MSDDFNIHIPLSKGLTSDSLIGIASTVSIDRDGERMSSRAIMDMARKIKEKGVNLFGNHQHDWENTLGVVKNAEVIDNNLQIGVSLDDSMTNPKVASLLKKLEKGIQLGLSVGGSVIKEKMEYDRELGRKVKVIDGVDLYEISVVGIPSNSDSFLSLPQAIAKSAKLMKLHRGTCEICNKITDVSIQYSNEKERHIRICDECLKNHKNKLNAYSKYNKIDSINKSNSKGYNFQCQECGKKFRNPIEECSECNGSDIDIYVSDEDSQNRFGKSCSLCYGTRNKLNAYSKYNKIDNKCAICDSVLINKSCPLCSNNSISKKMKWERMKEENKLDIPNMAYVHQEPMFNDPMVQANEKSISGGDA